MKSSHNAHTIIAVNLLQPFGASLPRPKALLTCIDRLFTSVPDLTKKSTYKKFIALLDNYIRHIDQADRSSIPEQTEQRTLLTSIQGTPVWQRTKSFLLNEGK